jgi:hypothetical protein
VVVRRRRSRREEREQVNRGKPAPHTQHGDAHYRSCVKPPC